ncbi:MAG: transglycosylase SLT domain-containing protein [Deltaproteobacteria bacterium]|nr:transglycosylase SLT domain-containing protein [Deltaproteobacteria bacterium]
MIPRVARPRIGSMILPAVVVGLILLLVVSSPAGTKPGEAVYEEVPLPDVLFLCGEPVPIEQRHVREMLDRELTISAWDQAQVFMWLKRASRYFPHIEKRLAEEGMPDDLKYLAVAESSLITHIRSHRGAMGPWQFMPRTARHNGLREDRRIDERRDFERSTSAALHYLKTLHGIFGNWALAMAAYNCGDTRLRKEMKLQRAESFYRLNLPLETERYIFRIAAIKLILEDPARYGYQIPENRLYRPVSCDRVEVNLPAAVPIVDVAEALGTDFKTIKELNPHILGYNLSPGRYVVKVPEGRGLRLTRVLETICKTYAADIDGNITGERYVVQRGDTLIGISRRSGVPVHTIQELNSIRGSLIRVGQNLELKP